MTAVKRIKELEELMSHVSDWKFMFKAFQVMREIAIAINHLDLGDADYTKTVEDEFEKRMAEEKS